MITRNQSGVIFNSYQGQAKKVLCVCSCGILRSPTMAVILSQAPYNFNTRAVGIDKDFALIPISDQLIVWADEVLCSDEKQKDIILSMIKEIEGELGKKYPGKVYNLNIPDYYGYMEETMILAIKERYDNLEKE